MTVLVEKSPLRMNPYPYLDQPFFNSPEEAALYFNSMKHYEPGMAPNHGGHDYPFMGAPMDYPFCQPLLPAQKPDTTLDGPTTDKEPVLVKAEASVQPLEVKFKKAPPQSPLPSDSASNYSDVLVKPQEVKPEKTSKPKRKRKSNPKKNTQCNIVNNVISYLACCVKSHSQLEKLLPTPQERQIFYIFLRNLRSTTPKYINRTSLKALIELEPNQAQERTLRKSTRRLLVVPMDKLRVILRKLTYNYIRGPDSLLPLLTSNKIKSQARMDHLHRRWDLVQFIQQSLTDYNTTPVSKAVPATKGSNKSAGSIKLPPVDHDSQSFNP